MYHKAICLGEKVWKRLQKEIVLKAVAKEVLNDMQTIAPKSPRHSVHGADIMEMVTFSKRGRKGYEIGLTNQGLGDKWSISRGLWFQEYKTDEKNYQWFTKWIKSVKKLADIFFFLYNYLLYRGPQTCK